MREDSKYLHNVDAQTDQAIKCMYCLYISDVLDWFTSTSAFIFPVPSSSISIYSLAIYPSHNKSVKFQYSFLNFLRNLSSSVGVKTLPFPTIPTKRRQCVTHSFSTLVSDMHTIYCTVAYLSYVLVSVPVIYPTMMTDNHSNKTVKISP